MPLTDLIISVWIYLIVLEITESWVSASKSKPAVGVKPLALGKTNSVGLYFTWHCSGRIIVFYFIFFFWRKSNSEHTENRLHNFSTNTLKVFFHFLQFVYSFLLHTSLSPPHTTGEMAFMISKTQQASISEPSHSGGEIQTESANDRVTSQLYLKTSESLDREIVLRRIRHHKAMNKVRNSLQSLFRGAQPHTPVSDYYEQKWLELGDTFSSP